MIPYNPDPQTDFDRIRALPIRFFTQQPIRGGGLTPAIGHESVLRSYHIVQKVKQLLGLGTPPSVVLEIIAELERVNADEEAFLTYLPDTREQATNKTGGVTGADAGGSSPDQNARPGDSLQDGAQ